MNKMFLSLIPLFYYLFSTPLPTWKVVATNKEAKNLASYIDISKDTNMMIYINVKPINTSNNRYNYISSDSIGLYLYVYIRKNNQYISVPDIKIDRCTLIDTDKNDTIKFSYTPYHFINDFKQIESLFQSIKIKDSLINASGGLRNKNCYSERVYDIEFIMDRKIKDVKHLRLDFKCRINGIVYEFNNSRFKVKKSIIILAPH